MLWMIGQNVGERAGDGYVKIIRYDGLKTDECGCTHFNRLLHDVPLGLRVYASADLLMKVTCHRGVWR